MLSYKKYIDRLSMNLFWRKVLQVPQTYLLAVGTIFGLSIFLHWVGIRPLTVIMGGVIALFMMGAWLRLLHPIFSATEDNVLDSDSFLQRLRQVAKKMGQNPSPPWKEAEKYSKECQQYCQKIVQKESFLATELIETLYTILDLSDQVAEAILALAQVQTEPYRVLAEKNLNTSLSRLVETHHQLQQLQDQALLSSLESAGDGNRLPLYLQSLIDNNRSALQHINQDSTQQNGDGV